MSDNDSEEKSSGRALNILNPKILTWMATKFCVDEGARTAVQDIINQYKEDFPKESLFMPLQDLITNCLRHYTKYSIMYYIKIIVSLYLMEFRFYRKVYFLPFCEPYTV